MNKEVFKKIVDMLKWLCKTLITAEVVLWIRTFIASFVTIFAAQMLDVFELALDGGTTLSTSALYAAVTASCISALKIVAKEKIEEAKEELEVIKKN